MLKLKIKKIEKNAITLYLSKEEILYEWNDDSQVAQVLKSSNEMKGLILEIKRWNIFTIFSSNLCLDKKISITSFVCTYIYTYIHYNHIKFQHLFLILCTVSSKKNARE